MSGIFTKLKTALSKTSDKITNNLRYLTTGKKLDADILAQLEDILLMADVGVNMTTEIIAILKKRKFDQKVTINEIKEELAKIIAELVEPYQHSFELTKDQLNIILMCGVNGNGKTTTIGKLAYRYAKQDKKIAIAACDTFRAAAVEQINVWAQRTGSTLFQGKEKSDPASVAHLAVTTALKDNTDILFVDTAGRLHNQKNLMQELAKIIRVIQKIQPDSPQHVLLAIDGSTGQNAVNQVREFKSIVNLSGLVITKLDGTAKAGAVISLMKEFQLPVYFIGLGESIDDLKNFTLTDFTKALLDL